MVRQFKNWIPFSNGMTVNMIMDNTGNAINIVITRFIRVIQFFFPPVLDCRDKPGNDINACAAEVSPM